mgnify:CR=1 FL=1
MPPKRSTKKGMTRKTVSARKAYEGLKKRVGVKPPRIGKLKGSGRVKNKPAGNKKPTAHRISKPKISKPRVSVKPKLIKGKMIY